MSFNFLASVIFLSTLLFPHHQAAVIHKAPVGTYTVISVPATVIATLPLATSSVAALIKIDAAKYGIDGEQLYKTLQCESGLRGDRVGLAGELGVAQIYLPAHPDLTRAQALDERFSIDWAAKSFAEGYAHWWTCYRQLYSSQKVLTQ